MLARTPSFDMPVYVNWSFLNASGYYEIDIIPGDYTVESEVEGYLVNSTTFFVSSGDTKWANMSLDPLPPETSVIQGYVREVGTGQPIVGAFVSVDFDASSNSTLANDTGYYAINVSAGDVALRVSATGFAAEERFLSVADDETRWENFTLVPTNSTVKGYITDQGTGLPIEGAGVFVGDMMSYTNFTSTNSTGYYEMRTIAGSLILAAFQTGYLSGFTFFSIVDDETRWINLTLRPEDAVLRGYVDEFGGAPLGGVLVELGMPPLAGNSTISDGTGYYEVGFGSGPVEMTASLLGYQLLATGLNLAPGVNWLNFTMYPELSDDATIQGYVNGSAPLEGAIVRAEGYGSYFNQTETNATGFYAMNVVPADQTLLTRASNHAPNWTAFTVANGETLWLNVTLDVDTTPPNVTALGAAPAVNVSAKNPTSLTGAVDEPWLDRTALSLFALRDASAGVRNYTFLTTFPDTDYDLVESSPGMWDLDFAWDAQIPAGKMGNASAREWTPLFVGFPGPWDLVFGQYRNATNPTPTMAIAFFSGTTGALELLSLGGPPQAPDDPTGEFQVVFQVWSLDDFNNILGPPTQLNGTWFSVLGLDLVRDDLVSSGNYGFWLQTWDYGDNYGQGWTFLDVDNTPPFADPGPDQSVLRTATVVFDGADSTDNVGIVNYTWTFDDGGVVTLYGTTPSHTFNAVGNFAVTLSVTDGARNTDTDTMRVNVTLDSQPPVADAGLDQAVDEDTVVTFDGFGSSDNVGIANYTWTFTDVTPRTLYGAGPTYLFVNPGTYLVTLTVADIDSNTGTDTVTITVNDITSPTADAGPDRVVDEDTVVTFDGSGSSDNVAIVNYTWTFDDGGAKTLYGVAPTYAFPESGSYAITLTVRDDAGNVGTDSAVVTVNDVTPPTATGGGDKTVLEDVQVDFDGTGSSDNVGVVNYTWDFGDGTLGYGATPTHTFANPGTYTAILTVRDAAGNEASHSLFVTVQRDTDGDGSPDVADEDDDGDGIPDAWEIDNGLDPLDPADATEDPDGDGLTNLDEYLEGTDPNRANWIDLAIWGMIVAVAVAAVIVGVLIWRRRTAGPPPPPEREGEPEESEPKDDR